MKADPVVIVAAARTPVVAPGVAALAFCSTLFDVVALIGCRACPLIDPLGIDSATAMPVVVAADWNVPVSSTRYVVLATAVNDRPVTSASVTVELATSDASFTCTHGSLPAPLTVSPAGNSAKPPPTSTSGLRAATPLRQRDRGFGAEQQFGR